MAVVLWEFNNVYWIQGMFIIVASDSVLFYSKVENRAEYSQKWGWRKGIYQESVVWSFHWVKKVCSVLQSRILKISFIYVSGDFALHLGVPWIWVQRSGWFSYFLPYSRGIQVG